MPNEIRQPPTRRRLLILRHAKSDWQASYGTDHDRPLNKRGCDDAPRMGRLIAGACAPDLVITSSAVRAQETVRRAAEAGRWTAKVEVERAFYGSDPTTVLARLRTVDDRLATVLIAGHEPTWSDMIATLTGARVQVPTAAAACIEIYLATWSDLRPGTGCLRWLVTPKILRRGAT